MSIVLVVIALVVGVVVMGKDLIETVQIRKFASQMEQYQTAVNTFKLKYNCIPGDCSSAASLGLGTSGNGSQIIADDWSCVTDSGVSNGSGCVHNRLATAIWPTYARGFGEGQLFWAHLSASGLIKGSFSSLAFAGANITSVMDLYFPKDVMGKAYLATFTWNGTFYIRTGMDTVGTTWTNPLFNSASLSAAQMNWIANKFSAPIVVTSSGFNPDAITQHQKIIPIGVYQATNGNERYIWQAPTVAQPSAIYKSCAVSDGSGGYVYNIANNGNCNVMWAVY